jgi:hypothetical protein
MNQCLQHKRAILLLLKHFFYQIEILKKLDVCVLLELLGDDQLLLQLLAPVIVDDISVFHVLEVVLDQLL